MAYMAVIGMGEWGWVLLAALLLFGAKKIPELARSMGTSINEFKKGMKEGGEPSAGSGESAKPAEKEK